MILFLKTSARPYQPEAFTIGLSLGAVKKTL